MIVGITAAAEQVFNPSWTSLVSTGTRNQYMRVSAENGISITQGFADQLVNGLLGSNGFDAIEWSNATGDGLQNILFDFDNKRCNIAGFRFLQSQTNLHGTWRIESSNNLITWNILHTFNLGGNTSIEYFFPNGKNYRYYRFIHVSGQRAASPWIQEIEFYAGYTSIGTGTTWTSPISTGDRRSLCTVSAINLPQGGGTVSQLIDGSFADIYWWTGDGTGYIQFDFGSTSRRIDGLRLYGTNVATAHGAWDIEASNDATSWVFLRRIALASYSVSPYEFRFLNSNSYRYYRLLHRSGTRSSSPYIREIEFRAA